MIVHTPTTVEVNEIAEQLAQELETAHLLFGKYERSRMKVARKCGRLLIRVKKLVGHDNYIPWLKANTTISYSCSCRYKKVAQKWKKINAYMCTHLNEGGSIVEIMKRAGVSKPRVPRPKRLRMPPLDIVALPEPSSLDPNIFRLDDTPDRNYLVLGDNVDYMRTLPNDSVDMVLCSPPYDNIAEMGGMYDFDLVAKELFRIIKPNQAVVWIEADQRVDNFKSGTTSEHVCKFRQIGFGLHDEMSMIRSHNQSPADYYHANCWERAVILSKGKIRKPNVLIDVPNLTAGREFHNPNVGHWQVKEFGKRLNAWYIKTGGVHTSVDPDVDLHPTKMPEEMADGHIRTWSYPGETVLDCFSGAGTTAKMALLNDRKFIGIECQEDWHTIACQRLRDAQQEQEKGKRLEVGDRGVPKSELEKST